MTHTAPSDRPMRMRLKPMAVTLPMDCIKMEGSPTV